MPAFAPQLRMAFHAHADADAWAQACMQATVAGLAQALREHASARLLVSGGSTPAPVYRRLAGCALAWDKIRIGLVDERWLAAGHPDSNAHLVEQSLLIDHAAAAVFEPVLGADANLAEALVAANRAAAPADVVLLGMGPDGHTASLFPHMRGFDEAVGSDDAYVAVDASGCAGAGQWPTRITMTPRAMARASLRLLLVRGEQKRHLLERALRGSDARELPIRIALALPGEDLQVHWCP